MRTAHVARENSHLQLNPYPYAWVETAFWRKLIWSSGNSCGALGNFIYKYGRQMQMSGLSMKLPHVRLSLPPVSPLNHTLCDMSRLCLFAFRYCLHSTQKSLSFPHAKVIWHMWHPFFFSWLKLLWFCATPFYPLILDPVAYAFRPWQHLHLHL